ncbi:dipeptide ABC transporter ATP-binding protein [Streptomyces sp. NPDC004629]|uniref:dipeptide ABC transporter ATP-binding protein n=1 Tax=Streptomyces sp. NPDC004629 TaxID=3364705 RepID=UPI0036999FB1
MTQHDERHSEGTAMRTTVQNTRQPLLSVSGLRVERQGPDGPRTVVNGVGLEVGAGETVGVVGESGSGKSITMRAVLGLLPRGLTATGEVRYGDRDLLGLSERAWRRTVRGTEIGMIMQDPFTMLNPIATCGDIIGASLRRHGGVSGRRALREESVRRLREVGIDDATVVDRYPFQMSGGMRQRVGIAAALASDPRILIADEPTTALDVTTQREILSLIKRIQADRGMALILITHDLRVAFAMCDRLHVLYAGSVVESAPAALLDAEPMHPYTNALLLAEPPVDRRVGEMVSIPGSVPAPDEVAGSCVFVSRCPWATDACRDGTPPLLEIAPGRWSACARLTAARTEMTRLRERAGQDLPFCDDTPKKEPVLSVAGVSKVFTGAVGGPVHALEDVSITVAQHESVGIVGESGSGKSTLARVVVGLEKPSTGTITIDGIPVTDWGRLSRSELRQIRRTVQIVFQDPYSSLNPMRSVGWALAEAITTHRSDAKNVGAEVERLLDEVGLAPAYAQKRPAALSGGMRQRVAIARALAARPKILICDESVSALDVSVQAQILNLLARLRDEHDLGYLFITHDLAVVRQVTERLYVMHRGRVVESGATAQVIDAPQAPYTTRLLASAPRAESAWLESTGRHDD